MRYRISSIMLIAMAIIHLVACEGKKEKIGYVVTQKLFDDYDGTKEIKKKITKTEEQQKNLLDSMSINIKLMETKYGEKDERVIKTKEKLSQVYHQVVTANQKQSEKYNEGIWKQINQYLSDYGKEKGYHFIYGANGNGSIMFADSTLDITKEVLVYINGKNKGE